MEEGASIADLEVGAVVLREVGPEEAVGAVRRVDRSDAGKVASPRDHARHDGLHEVEHTLYVRIHHLVYFFRCVLVHRFQATCHPCIIEQHINVARLLEKFEPDRTLARDDQIVIEGMHEDAVLSFFDAPRFRRSCRVGAAPRVSPRARGRRRQDR